jgi:demethylmenaquinone methyltransferase / 2-methoxy-6-polyprenyl-1,4-benzoquinol methylase
MSNDSADRAETSAAAITRANLGASLRDRARKQSFVTPLFDLIAPRYDHFTRVFSYGMDARWKNELVEWIAEDHPPGAPLRVLDVASGTGDLALQIAVRRPLARVLGIDVSREMLRLARARVRAADRERIAFETGDMARLTLAAGSVDVISAGYAVRNAPDPRAALGGFARVLRPGGRLYVLDFFRPPDRAWRTLYLAYLRLAGMAVGWWWHRAPAAYEYIAASIEHFATRDEFVRWLSAADLRVDRVATKLGGGVALIAATRR